MARSGPIASIAGAAIAFAVACRPSIAATDLTAPQSFDPKVVKRGRVLAAIGNCNDCHTVAGGKSLAGGLPVWTPFGRIFSTNITPDLKTGIGRWSEADFRRAMRSGVDRDGRHLYPTFPYDHFTNVTDEDDHAIYAYLMTREPVSSPAPENELRFPLNQRLLIAGWKLLFLHPATFKPDSTKSAEWNRGAYLVQGLAHCGSCHTPRNAFGAERTGASFSGCESDDWSAYAINTQSPAPVPWDADALYAYLVNGWHKDHGTARGPMAEVVSSLSSAPASDVHAIATYMADVFGAPSREQSPKTALVRAGPVAGAAPHPGSPHPGSQGEAIYAAACAACHEGGRSPPYGGINLSLSSAVSAADPRNLVNIVLAGVRPVEGVRSPVMPGFAASMNDAQIAALMSFLRSRFTREPEWSNIEQTVEDARRAQTARLP